MKTDFELSECLRGSSNIAMFKISQCSVLLYVTMLFADFGVVEGSSRDMLFIL